MQAIAPSLSNGTAPLAAPVDTRDIPTQPPERSHAAYAALVDVAPQLAPALDFTLRIAGQGLAGDDLAALIDHSLIDIVIAQEANPDIAAPILDLVVSAIEQRRPFETVHEVCARALSEKSLRDLRRSIGRAQARATPGEVHSWRTHISRWLGDLRDFLEQARWAGSGHSVTVNGSEPFAAPLPDPLPAPQPRLRQMNFARHGVVGFVLFWLYNMRVAHGSPLPGIPGIPDAPAFPSNPFAQQHPQMPSHFEQAVAAYRNVTDTAQLAEPAIVHDNTPSAAARLQLTASRAKRLPREAPTEQASPALTQAVSPTHAALPDVDFGDISLGPTFQQSVRTFVETVRNRTDSHEAALAQVDSVVNLRTHLESKLKQALTAGASGQLASLDDVRLYKFDSFGFARNPGTYDLNHLERGRPQAGIPILDAALQIVSGDLPISLSPDVTTMEFSPATYGVYAGDLRGDHYYRADAQVPGLSITQLLGVTAEWRWLGDEGEMPDTGLRLLTALDGPQRWLARDDLRLSHTAKDISTEAAVLGELVLTQPEATGRIADGGEHGNVTAYTLHAGPHNIVVAGVFAASEHPNRGKTLLYLAGDARPWREYESPEALQSALVSSPRSALPEAILARLPARVIEQTPDTRPTFRLTLTPNDPLRIAREASLTVLRDDMRFNVTQACTPARRAHYAAWFAGAAPDDRYHALQVDARENARLSPGKHGPNPVVLLPQNIEQSIEAMLDLRLRLSLALPDERRIAREMVRDALSDVGASALDPDDMRLEIRATGQSAQSTPPTDTQPIVTMSLIDAALAKIEGTFPELHAGQVLALTRSENAANVPTATTEPLPDAAALIKQISINGYRDRLQSEVADFASANAPQIRHNLQMVFALDAIASATQAKLDADLIALARAVADGAQWGDGLAPRGAVPIHFTREWLCINGYDSTAVLITDRATRKILMFAPQRKDTSVLGFQNRAALDTWIGEQVGDSAKRLEIVAMFRPTIHATINEYLLANVRSESSDHRVAPHRALIDAICAPVDGDIFKAAGERLAQYAESTMTTDRSLDPDAVRESVVQLTRTVRYFDLALGAASWVAYPIKPLSLAISAVDAGLGTVLLAGDGEWRREGLKSIATAIGTQGLAASRLKVLGSIPGGARFRFFREGEVSGEDGVINGLYFIGSRFVARIDQFTHANLEFDTEVAEFRLMDPRTRELGPYMKLGRNGAWRCVPKPAPGDATTLTDPHVLYDIERAFGERLQAVNTDIDHAQRQVFRNAKQVAMFRADAAQRPNLLTPSAYHKLHFIAPEVVDHAALGSIAGEIESAMDAEAALELVGNIVNEAPSLGAVVTTVQTVAGINNREIEGGLVRAMAVAVRDSREGTLLTRHGEYAMAPTSSATRTYLTSLRQLGTSQAADETIELGGNIALARDVGSLSRALDGKATTPITYQLSTPRHTMLFGRRVSELGNPEYFFFDPAVACIVHTDRKVLLELVTRHLKFMRPTYGSFETPGSPVVVLRRIKVNDLAQTPVSFRAVADLSRAPVLPH
ncbi:Toxin Afp18 [Pandoraea pneumonica]|uniref:Toxin Afp18 n=1 Tax=Pandoraea pneumonica TaxID=2508299 RepID=A0A5E4YSD2_9BURK|nr:DUF6543 domain-containing protein [Pandoraea pneumonica]VVE51691.1 Toxin Afp18 [Pandoraea pneumonica]